jgi:hypothetical protein
MVDVCAPLHVVPQTAQQGVEKRLPMRFAPGLASTPCVKAGFLPLVLPRLRGRLQRGKQAMEILSTACEAGKLARNPGCPRHRGDNAVAQSRALFRAREIFAGFSINCDDIALRYKMRHLDDESGFSRGRFQCICYRRALHPGVSPHYLEIYRLG